MNVVCSQCNEGFEATRTDSKYCSASCRKLAFQNRKLSVPLSVPKEALSVPNLSVPAKKDLSVPKPIKEMDHDELRMAIDSYGGTTWDKDPEYDASNDWTVSAEYKEMKHRVDTWSIKKLEDEGYQVPARRR